MTLPAVRKNLILLTFSLLLVSALVAQQKKYPSLLWEITGNGLKRPSYLFGTMHVSSKMVFHLSDSFYLDIRNSEVVALELDPQLWQDQMYRFENMQTNLRFYTQGSPGDYLNEKSFQPERYEDDLKAAFSGEPTVINGLLYRSYQTRADFEEDTYLDLYIYQTGRKLGKRATGVENYFETERLIMEAAQDMMKDKKKKAPDTEGASPYEVEKQTQEAYRKGDLDALDSLEKLMEPSESYMEKFLYRRNEIQAASIDTIIQHHTLFVGVGAAHLPGKRGVIELLRAKGYTLRPVIMPDHDATQRDDIDKIRVPVSFTPFTSADGDFSVALPGKLYQRERAADSWQYADMSNGAYYMISRVKTHAPFLGQREEAVLKKVDSLLYENIPGKILKKTPIVRDGYKGYDITSRTRRGDIQRYHILVTPYEVLVFKMSGNSDYVEGKEGDRFFSSIELHQPGPAGWADFTPTRGGWHIQLPRTPFQYKNTTTADGITRWEYEATDSATGDAFLVWSKSVQNYHFLEEDTADLALMEESFRLSDCIDKSLSRRAGLYKGYPCINAMYQEKDGSYIRAKFLLRGPHYFLLASRSRNKDRAFPAFFETFGFVPYRYEGFRNYTDSFINISVTTPVTPDIDAGMRRIIERATSEEFLNSIPDYNGYWPHAKTALFQDDSTGEAVFVSAEAFPKYYYPRDSASFWEDETNEKKVSADYIIRSRTPFRFSDSVAGMRYVLSDTNTSRQMTNWFFLKDNHFYRVISLGDTMQTPDLFTDRFFTSVRPLDKTLGAPVFRSKLDLFFGDFYSKDSAISHRAKEAIANVYFGAAGVPSLLKAIQALPYNEKDYFDTKVKLINELGYIDDSSATEQVVDGLKKIYERASDTSTFQNAVLKALAHHKTRQAYALLRVLLVQDPPIFEGESDYNYLFQDLGDSLPLARTLFPELLQLATVDDYKSNIQSLLSTLVDSGYLKAADYESYFSQVYFDAKIQWKKQEGKDEKRLQKKGDDGDDDGGGRDKEGDDADDRLDSYAVLLMPFFDKNATVPHFFEKLLQSKDASVRLNTAILLLRNNKPVADSVIRALAATDQYRSRLLKALTDIHQGQRFPAAFRNQLSIARSLLLNSGGESEFFDIQLVGKRTIQFKQQKGILYYFKYKQNKEDEWQIGLSGLQPLNSKDVSTDDDFVRLTGKKIKGNTPELAQFDQQLKRLLFSKRKSAAAFYQDGDYYNRRMEEE